MVNIECPHFYRNKIALEPSIKKRINTIKSQIKPWPYFPSDVAILPFEFGFDTMRGQIQL